MPEKSTGKAGKASGTRTPRRPTTIPPLIKSCAQAIVLWGLPWYLEATKLRTMKAKPPTKTQGNQDAIVGGGDKNWDGLAAESNIHEPPPVGRLVRIPSSNGGMRPPYGGPLPPRPPQDGPRKLYIHDPPPVRRFIRIPSSKKGVEPVLVSYTIRVYETISFIDDRRSSIKVLSVIVPGEPVVEKMVIANEPHKSLIMSHHAPYIQ